MKRTEKTLSFAYLLPLVNKEINSKKNGIINVYLFDINNPDKINYDYLFILVDSFIFKSYLDNDYIIDKYEVDDNYYMLVVKLPESYKADIKLIVNGKYSKIQNDTKRLILNYHNLKPHHKLYKVLYKVKEYKEEIENNLNVKLSNTQELGEIFDLHKETYTNLIKEKEYAGE